MHCDTIIEYDTFFYILQCMHKLLHPGVWTAVYELPYLYEGLLESISRRFLFSESSDKSSSTGATWRIRQNNQYCTTLVYSFTKTALNIQVLNLTQITKIPVKQMNIVTCNIRETYTWHCFILLFIYDFTSKYINLFSSTWISPIHFFLNYQCNFHL